MDQKCSSRGFSGFWRCVGWGKKDGDSELERGAAIPTSEMRKLESDDRQREQLRRLPRSYGRDFPLTQVPCIVILQVSQWRRQGETAPSLNSPVAVKPWCCSCLCAPPVVACFPPRFRVPMLTLAFPAARLRSLEASSFTIAQSNLSPGKVQQLLSRNELPRATGTAPLRLPHSPLNAETAKSRGRIPGHAASRTPYRESTQTLNATFRASHGYLGPRLPRGRPRKVRMKV